MVTSGFYEGHTKHNLAWQIFEVKHECNQDSRGNPARQLTRFLFPLVIFSDEISDENLQLLFSLKLYFPFHFFLKLFVKANKLKKLSRSALRVKVSLKHQRGPIWV